MKSSTTHSAAHTVALHILANKGKSFYWASQFLGKKHRDRAARLYGFCRYLDDMVDEENQIGLAKQNVTEIQEAVLAESSNQLTLDNGIQLFKECHIPQDVVLDLISGIKSDTELVRIANEHELLHYCYQVAGTVGLMMCNALDTVALNAKPYAIDLGIAMQLTNICRDIKTDALVNRRYIPADLIENIETCDLISPNEEQSQTIRKAVATLLQLADTYYESGEKGLFYLPIRARLSILIAARIYHDIGNQLKAEGYEYWQRRMFVSTARKCVITIHTIVTVCCNRHFWFRPKCHEARLQNPLNASSHYGLY